MRGLFELTENLEYVGDLFVEFELSENKFTDLVDRVNIIDSINSKQESDDIRYLYEHIEAERKS